MGIDVTKNSVYFDPGIYTGTVSSAKHGESPKKRTPFVEYQLVSGTKSIKATFYLSDKALFMLDRFCMACGIPEDVRRDLDELNDPINCDLCFVVDHNANNYVECVAFFPVDGVGEAKNRYPNLSCYVVENDEQQPKDNTVIRQADSDNYAMDEGYTPF